MRRTVGPGGTIRVRSDSRWMVPEPELGVVLGEDGEPVAVTIGNDVSSRDIEGANPLYIPQAKIFAGRLRDRAGAAVPDDWDAPFTIRLRITDADGAELFAGETSTATHEAHAARARRVGRARQPGPARLRAADRHRASCRPTSTRSSPATWSRSRSTASACSPTPSRAVIRCDALP